MRYLISVLITIGNPPNFWILSNSQRCFNGVKYVQTRLLQPCQWGHQQSKGNNSAKKKFKGTCR